MSQQEIWEQESFTDLIGIGDREKEALSYYLIPKGTVVWPEKAGRIIDRYRGALVENAIATPLLTEAEESKKQKRERGMFLWNLLGREKKLPDGSIAVAENAALHLDGRYWQIRSGTIIATGSKKENKISKIK